MIEVVNNNVNDRGIVYRKEDEKYPQVMLNTVYQQVVFNAVIEDSQVWSDFGNDLAENILQVLMIATEQ